MDRPGEAGNVPVARDRGAYIQLRSSLASNDLAAIRRLTDFTRVLLIPNGTKGIVIDVLPDARLIRLLEGAHSGTEGMVDPDFLEPVLPSLGLDAHSSERATAILQAGKNHERDGRKAPAILCYSQVVNGWPGTTQAVQAEQRIANLGGVVDPTAMPPGISSSVDVAPRPRRQHRLPDFSAVDSAIGSMGASALSGSRGGGLGGSTGRGTTLCGAPTKTTGAPCRNPVAGGGYCYLHR